MVVCFECSLFEYEKCNRHLSFKMKIAHWYLQIIRLQPLHHLIGRKFLWVKKMKEGGGRWWRLRSDAIPPNQYLQLEIKVHRLQKCCQQLCATSLMRLSCLRFCFTVSVIKQTDKAEKVTSLMSFPMLKREIVSASMLYFLVLINGQTW